MRVAAVAIDPTFKSNDTWLLWIDPEHRRILRKIDVPYSPNVEILPQARSAVVAYTSHPGGEAQFTADIYRLPEWNRVASLPMNCRATFNVRQFWQTIQPGPTPNLVYVFKVKTLGDHLEADLVCGLDLESNRLSDWQFPLPRNVIGWAGAGGDAHLQFLFSSEGLFEGQLPTHDFDQSVGFWLGPERGMGPIVSIGPRPEAHSDLGHARAICTTGLRTVVVRNDGRIHVLDPKTFQLVGLQHLETPPEKIFVEHSAIMDPNGKYLYVGVAEHNLMRAGISERILVHDLEAGRTVHDWKLDGNFQHFSLTERGDYLFGAVVDPNQVQMINTRTGEVEARIPVDGRLHYLVATSEA